MSKVFSYISFILGIICLALGFFISSIFHFIGAVWVLAGVVGSFGKDNQDMLNLREKEKGLNKVSGDINKTLDRRIHKKKQEVIFHGISSTQRGGSSYDKLMKILDSEILFPAGNPDNLDEIDKLRYRVFQSAFSEGIEEKIDIDDYIGEKVLENKDSDFLNSSEIRRYVTDDKFRGACKEFKVTEIDMNSQGYDARKFLNWFDTVEEDTKKTYGKEFYFEFSAPSEKLKFGEGGVIATMASPLSLKNAKRLVVSSDYKEKIPAIERKLKEKGLGHIRIESPDSFQK